MRSHNFLFFFPLFEKRPLFGCSDSIKKQKKEKRKETSHANPQPSSAQDGKKKRERKNHELAEFNAVEKKKKRLLKALKNTESLTVSTT